MAKFAAWCKKFLVGERSSFIEWDRSSRAEIDSFIIDTRATQSCFSSFGFCTHDALNDASRRPSKSSTRQASKSSVSSVECKSQSKASTRQATTSSVPQAADPAVTSASTAATPTSNARQRLNLAEHVRVGNTHFRGHGSRPWLMSFWWIITERPLFRTGQPSVPQAAYETSSASTGENRGVRSNRVDKRCNQSKHSESPKRSGVGQSKHVGKKCKEAQRTESTTPLEPDNRTTCRVRNIPNDYTRIDLVDMLDEKKLQYDFVYVPADFGSGVNRGFAFVNLVSNSEAEKARDALTGYCNWKVASMKVCEVDWALTQGLEANIVSFKKSAVMHPDIREECKPLLFKNRQPINFPEPTRRINTPKQLKNKQQQKH